MTNIQHDVEDFMVAADQPYAYIAKYGDLEDQEILYMSLIEEEYLELVEAFKNKDVVETADAICDLVWVAMGLASTLGIDFESCWKEVTDSNMSKVVSGKLMKNPKTGKVMKPDTYFPPNLARVLGVDNEPR